MPFTSSVRHIYGKGGNDFGKENKLEGYFVPSSSAVYVFSGECVLQNGSKAGNVFL